MESVLAMWCKIDGKIHGFKGFCWCCNYYFIAYSWFG